MHQSRSNFGSLINTELPKYDSGYESGLYFGSLIINTELPEALTGC